MNLTWHLVKKDLARAWLPLALFAAFIATKLVLGALILHELDFNRVDDLHDYLKVATFAEIVFGYVLVAVLVQEDPLVGTSAFWMTRPVSGLRLLGAKLIELAIALLLLPILVTLPWWLGCGLDVRSIGIAALQLATLHTMLILLGLPIATLTRNLARYLACTLVAVLLWFAVVVNTFGHFTSSDRAHVLPLGVADTRDTIFALLLLATSIAVVLHQFRTRRSSRSLAILASGAALMLLVLSAWSWNWSPLWRRFSPPTAASVKLEIQRAILRHRNPPLDPEISVHAQLKGLPEDQELTTFHTRQHWRWPDGTEAHLKAQIQKAETYSDVRELLGLPPHPHGETRAVPRLPEKFVSRSSLAPHLAARATEPSLALTLEVAAQLRRARLLAELDVRERASFDDAGRKLRILQLDVPIDDKITFHLLEISSPAPTRPTFPSKLFLVDRSSGLLVPSFNQHSQRIDVAGVSIAKRTVTFQPRLMDKPANFSTRDGPQFLSRFRLASIVHDVTGNVRCTASLPPAAVQVE